MDMNTTAGKETANWARKTAALLLAALLLVTGGCFKTSTAAFAIEEITVGQLQTMIDNKESFLLLTERDDCPFCEKLNEYLEQTKEGHNVLLYKLDTTDFDFKKENAEDKTLVSDTEDGKKFLELQPRFLYTPAIYKYVDGQADQAAIGFNAETNDISIWDTASTIDFSEAETENVWTFLESK